MTTPTHDDIEQRAYQCWEARGAPLGTPEIDWAEAEAILATAEAEAALPPETFQTQ